MTSLVDIFKKYFSPNQFVTPHYDNALSSSDFISAWGGTLGLPILVGGVQLLRILWYFDLDVWKLREPSNWGKQEFVLLAQPLINMAVLEAIQVTVLASDLLLKPKETEYHLGEEEVYYFEMIVYAAFALLVVLPMFPAMNFFSIEIFSGFGLFFTLPLVIVVLWLTLAGFDFLSQTVFWGMPLIIWFIVEEVMKAMEVPDVFGALVEDLTNMFTNWLLVSVLVVDLIILAQQMLSQFILTMTLLIPYLDIFFPQYFLIQQAFQDWTFLIKFIDILNYYPRIWTLILVPFVLFFVASQFETEFSPLEADLQYMTPVGFKEQNYIERSIGWGVELGQVAALVLTLITFSYHYINFEGMYEAARLDTNKIIYDF